MPTRRDILRQIRLLERQHYCARCSEPSRQVYSAAARAAQAFFGCKIAPDIIDYGQDTDNDRDTPNIGLDTEPEPFTRRGAQDAPVRVKQPERHRNFLRGDHRMGYEAKGPAVNPWAICTAAVGRKNKDKYEQCIQAIKAKHKIKRD